MKRRTALKFAAALALTTSLATGAVSAETIKIGAAAPKTGPLAGGAAVSQWPNVTLWAAQVNERGGLNVGGTMMPVEIIEYDDQTNPGETIKAIQRLATQDEVNFIVSPYGTGLVVAAAPIFARYGYPLIAVSAITDQQPALSKQLRDRKLAALAPLQAEQIVSANIGCIQHLQSGTAQPVRHWVEVLDDALRGVAS